MNAGFMPGDLVMLTDPDVFRSNRFFMCLGRGWWLVTGEAKKRAVTVEHRNGKDVMPDDFSPDYTRLARVVFVDSTGKRKRIDRRARFKPALGA